MALINRTFNGKLNLDAAPYVLPNTDFSNALNITRDAEDEGQDYIVTNIKGNSRVLYSLPEGTNKCIGTVEDKIRYRIYYWIWNSEGNGLILYYNGLTQSIIKVFEDKTDSGGEEILNLTASGKIIVDPTCILYGNDGDLIHFIDSLKRPSQINVDLATAGFYGVWQRSYLDAAKEPPTIQPICIFVDDASVTVNNLKKRLFKFSTRFVYENDEKSVYSARSAMPLPYDSSNPDEDTDPTKNSCIQIIVPTGALNVLKIELVGQVSLGTQFSDPFLIAVIDKDALSLNNNDTYLYNFFNDKAYPPADITEFLQPYDYVPLEANAQAAANGNTQEYGGIVEGYDRIAIDVDATPSMEADVNFQYPKASLFAVQVGSEIHITVIGTPRQNDTFVINTTNITFGYTASTGDSSSDVIIGLANNAMADGFTVNLYDDNNLFIEQTGETLVSFEFNPYVPASFTDITPVWDWASKTSFALLYLDDKGRSIAGALTDDSITVQWGMNNLDLPYVTLSINNRPPIEAKSFQWLRTKDLAKQNILQFISSATAKDDEFAYISLSALDTYLIDNPSAATQLQYSFTPGDRIEFIRLYNTDGTINQFYNNNSTNYEILDLVVAPTIAGVRRQGRWIKISLPTVTGVFDFGVGWANYFFELYTPAQPLSNDLNVYYEFNTVSFRIFDAGTDERYHEGQIQNQTPNLSQPATFEFRQGDYYYRNRTMYAGAQAKYTVDNGLVIKTASERWFIKEELTENTFDPLQVTFRTMRGDSIDTVGSDKWFGQILDSTSRTLNFSGSITVQANEAKSSEFWIYVTYWNGSTYLSAILATSPTSFLSGQTMQLNFNANVPFIEGAMYLELFTSYDFDCTIVGGEMTIKEVGQLFNINVIDENFSDFYPSAVNSNGRAWAIEPNARQIYNPVLIRFSREYQQDTSTNNLNRFYQDNFIEVDRSNGDIQRMFIDGRRMYTFQQFDVGVVPVLVQVVIDNANNPLEANSDILLNKVQYPYSGKYGMGEMPTAFAYGKGNIYFIDPNKKIVCQIPQTGGIVPLSIVYETNSFFVDKLTLYRKDFNNGFGASGEPYTGDPCVYGIFNEYTNKYIIALEEINRYDEDGELIEHQDPYTISYVNSNLQVMRGFESFYSYYPEMFGILNTLMVSFKNGELWKHDSSTYCNFYSQQFSAYIEGVFNDVLAAKKTWESISQIATITWTCPIIYTNTLSYGTTRQESELIEQDFDVLEEMPTANFLRDTNSIGGLLNGDWLKGNIMIIRFLRQNASDLVILSGVSVMYKDSALTAK